MHNPFRKSHYQRLSSFNHKGISQGFVRRRSQRTVTTICLCFWNGKSYHVNREISWLQLEITIHEHRSQCRQKRLLFVSFQKPPWEDTSDRSFDRNQHWIVRLHALRCSTVNTKQFYKALFGCASGLEGETTPLCISLSCSRARSAESSESSARDQSESYVYRVWEGSTISILNC